MSTALSPLLAPMLSSTAMRAVCDDRSTLQNMLDFEAALARAEAATGVIPAAAVGPIEAACKAESFDPAALAEAATRSGNLAIPLVKALTANVAKADAEAARYVHWGATSQDVIDTATMLALRAGIDALDADLSRAIKGFAALARNHRNTAMVARTWLQHALPMPFGSRPPNMRQALPAPAAASGGSPARASRCNSAARPARSRPSATRGSSLRSDWRGSSTCRCRKRPGTPIATGSRRPRPASPFWREAAARSRATSR